VQRFATGFIVASVLWAGLAFLYIRGVFGPLGPDAAEPVAQDEAPTVAPESAKVVKAKRVRRPRRGADGRAQAQAPVGDQDIGWDGPQTIDMAGGEGQLTGGQIEAGFDSAMPKIRRCLILVPADGEITGKLLFGMRVGNDGTPRAVNLTGPSVVTGGDSGSCLRSAAQAIRFASFPGPDMVFKYPITLQ
jgi:hypothetical protein